VQKKARKGASQEPPHLEVQIHPNDIRRGVWYFFLSRKQFRWWLVGLAGATLFVLFNLAILPSVVSGLLSRSEYKSLVAERARHGERLQVLVERLTELRSETDDLHLQMSRIYLAYGLRSNEDQGQGGFPFDAEEAPQPIDSIYTRSLQQGLLLEARVKEQMNVLGTFIGEVQAFEAANGDQVSTTPSITPLRGPTFVLTSPFGNRRSPFTKQIDFHPGVDLAAPVGTPVHASADGVVVFAGRYPLKQSVRWWRYGNLVAVRNGDRFVTLYGHCDEVLVRHGQEVRQGDVIARVGNSGWSTNPHLHYEVRQRTDDGEWEPVDPRIYILDHRWRDEERLLVRARTAPSLQNYEPLLSRIRR